MAKLIDSRGDMTYFYRLYPMVSRDHFLTCGSRLHQHAVCPQQGGPRHGQESSTLGGQGVKFLNGAMKKPVYDLNLNELRLNLVKLS